MFTIAPVARVITLKPVLILQRPTNLLNCKTYSVKEPSGLWSIMEGKSKWQK